MAAGTVGGGPAGSPKGARAGLTEVRAAMRRAAEEGAS